MGSTPRSSSSRFSGLRSRCVMPMLCRYTYGWDGGHCCHHGAPRLPQRCPTALTTPAISCWKKRCASGSGIPMSGSATSKE